MVAPAGYPSSELPGVISRYLSPSVERLRISTVESTGSGSTSWLSSMSSFATVRPSSSRTGVIAFTRPTRMPPIRTSLLATRELASGTRAESE